jgi:ER membrane protein complex subunit 1
MLDMIGINRDLMIRSNYSSFDDARLESIGFSFVIENGVSAIGVTTTHAGITSREILVSFEHGMLQGLSRKFLDPRRPVGGLTAEEKEEGLVPYFPAMPTHGPLVVTYFLQVLGINRIQSIATNLESTSVIVASGIDIFCTKRTPSKTFDTLSPDFSYLQLIASIAVLSLGVLLTDRAVESKRVREAWQ